MEDFSTSVEEDFHSALEGTTSSSSEVFTASDDGQESEGNPDALGTIPFYPNEDDIQEWMNSSKLTQSGEEFVIP